MTPDQKAKLEARRNALLDVLVEEADPSGWPSSDTKEGRGDRAWLKTNAIKTAALIVKIEDLVGLRGVLRPSGAPGNPNSEEVDEGETDDAAEAASERETEQLIRDAGAKVRRLRDGGNKKKKG
jgi:hypothetical protein